MTIPGQIAFTRIPYLASCIVPARVGQALRPSMRHMLQMRCGDIPWQPRTRCSRTSPAVVLHVAGVHAHEEEHAAQVHFLDAVPVLVIDLEGVDELGDAGLVDDAG